MLAQVGKDKHLTTQFMNQTNFDKQSIKVYPYAQRRFFLALFPGGDQRFYGTDVDSATWFATERWGMKPQAIEEISEMAYTSRGSAIGGAVAVPKVKLSHPVVVFNGDCFDREAMTTIVDAMDASIKSVTSSLQSYQRRTGRPIGGTSAGAKELGLLQSIRDSLTKAPICGTAQAKTAVKAAPVKEPVAQKTAVKKQQAKKEPEIVYPLTKVTNKQTGQIVRWEDAEGKIVPQSMWPKAR